MLSLTFRFLSGVLLTGFLLTALPVHAEDEYDLPPQGQGGGMPATTSLQMRMNALETQLRNVTGQLERAQFQNQQLQQNIQRMNSDYDARFQMLEKKLSTPPPAAPAAMTTPPPGAEDAPSPQTGTSKPEHTLGTLSSEGSKAGDPQAMYDTAFASLRQARYEDAEAKLRAFLKANPKHRLSENARYWLGETYYVRGKFQEAALTFSEGFQQFPTGSKAPDNLLKLAMSLGSINKKQDACTTLSELKKRFPNASAIIRNRAEQEKKTLSCS